MLRKALAAFSALVVVSVVGISAHAQAPRAAAAAASSATTAAPITLPLASGGEWTLGEDASRATLVVFWGIWCEPCREGMPALAALTERWRPQGVEVVMANTDGAEFRERITKIVADESLPMRSAIDEDAALNIRLTGAIATPAAVLLAPDGTTLWRGPDITGPAGQALEARLRQLVGG